MECKCIYSSEKSKYHEMEKIIKNDFEKLLMLFDDYKNNKELIGELKKVIKYICDNKITSLLNSRIELLPNYLYFDYIEPNDNNGCEDYDYISVIMNRNGKNFYFVYRLNPSIGIIIKEFNIKDNTVIYNKYKDNFASPIFDETIYIYPDILRLKRLPKIN